VADRLLAEVAVELWAATARRAPGVAIAVLGGIAVGVGLAVGDRPGLLATAGGGTLVVLGAGVAAGRRLR
jgi:hypothetical protein